MSLTNAAALPVVMLMPGGSRASMPHILCSVTISRSMPLHRYGRKVGMNTSPMRISWLPVLCVYTLKWSACFLYSVGAGHFVTCPSAFLLFQSTLSTTVAAVWLTGWMWCIECFGWATANNLNSSMAFSPRVPFAQHKIEMKTSFVLMRRSLGLAKAWKILCMKGLQSAPTTRPNCRSKSLLSICVGSPQVTALMSAGFGRLSATGRDKFSM
mmetsp:Transcript_103030/g.315205  ORF Transcript_103030/g.315205 Transcript_103030/m.315205 type:complete len:212 (-) Transcript_103030:2892-3527(-)